MRRLPSPDELGLWRRAMHGVVPLPGRLLQRQPDYPLSIEAAPVPPRVRDKTPAPKRSATLPSLDRLSGLDGASAERLKRGRYPIDARLDLHGLTQDEAHAAVAQFLARSRAVGHRCVLVITGHGRTSGGILKNAVPRWLNEPRFRSDLLAAIPARPRDGGGAALYLLLRRIREPSG